MSLNFKIFVCSDLGVEIVLMPLIRDGSGTSLPVPTVRTRYLGIWAVEAEAVYIIIGHLKTLCIRQ